MTLTELLVELNYHTDTPLMREVKEHIDALKYERDTLRTQYLTVRDALAAEQQMEPMTAVADRFAHRLALALECVLFEKDQPTSRWWDEAMQLIGEYRSAMNDIHEQHSPTFMGEPVLKEQP